MAGGNNVVVSNTVRRSLGDETFATFVASVIAEGTAGGALVVTAAVVVVEFVEDDQKFLLFDGVKMCNEGFLTGVRSIDVDIL